MKEEKQATVSTRQLVSHLSRFVRKNPEKANEIISNSSAPPKFTYSHLRDGIDFHQESEGTRFEGIIPM